MDCHALSYTARIKAINKVITWDDSWTTKGCVHSIFKRPFYDLGTVSFHRIRGQYTDTLMVSFSHIKWNVDRGDPYRYLGNIARKIMGWFETEYDAQLTHFKKCAGDHMSIPVRHPHLIQLAQESTITVDNTFQLDASPPERVPHVESMRGYDPLRRILTAADHMDDLEGRVAALEEKMDRVIAALAELPAIAKGLTDLRAELHYTPSKDAGERQEINWS